jgi:hypothetical protein
MLAVEYCPNVFNEGALPNHELLEINHSKISLHHAKSGYDYPTIRLSYMFSKLVGLSTCIYQTVYEGALAFLVVVSSIDKAAEKSVIILKNASKNAKSPALTWRRSPVRIRPSPFVFLMIYYSIARYF